jgi:hypothetical protein
MVSNDLRISQAFHHGTNYFRHAPKTFSFDAAKARNAFRQASDLQ